MSEVVARTQRTSAAIASFAKVVDLDSYGIEVLPTECIDGKGEVKALKVCQAAANFQRCLPMWGEELSWLGH